MELIQLASRGEVAAVEALLQRGVDVNSRTKEGWTALMEAAYQGQRATVELLLSHGAQIDTRNDSGATALYVPPAMDTSR